MGIVYIPSKSVQVTFYGVKMASERLLDMSIKVLYLPKIFYTPPQTNFWLRPLGLHRDPGWKLHSRDVTVHYLVENCAASTSCYFQRCSVTFKCTKFIFDLRFAPDPWELPGLHTARTSGAKRGGKTNVCPYHWLMLNQSINASVDFYL